MKYQNTCIGIFKERPNRFIAHVEIEGKIEVVHVKNTGRCKELLVPDAQVILTKVDKLERKTKYDLIGVYKEGLGWVNMDSQAPNKVVEAWLIKEGCIQIKREFTYGKSRLDFCFIKDGKKYLMEVKGCTLEIKGQGYFPDAPTSRGSKHIYELIKGQEEGYQGILAFVIQMPTIKNVLPNEQRDPEFAKAYEAALKSGVKILELTCDVTPSTLAIAEENHL